MRLSGNSHPEWGYLAPAPSFLRTARTVIVATAIGATAGAGVVFSLVDRPAADDSLPAASVAARTLARPIADAAPAAVKNAATGKGVAVSSAATSASVQTQPGQSAAVAPKLAGSGQDRQDRAHDVRRDAAIVAGESSAVSTTQPPAAIATLAEAPMAKEPSDSSLTEIQAVPAAATAAESTLAADTPPAPKKVAKKHRTAPRYAARGDQPPLAANNAAARPPPFQRLFNYGADDPYAGGYFRFSGR